MNPNQAFDPHYWNEQWRGYLDGLRDRDRMRREVEGWLTELPVIRGRRNIHE